MRQDVLIIISINVHEKPQFLIKQLENINSFVTSKFVVILSCNDYMFNELKHQSLPEYVHINPEVINKQPWSGLITKGIYSNMKYALKDFDFMYFAVLSSRNIFYNKMSCNDLINNNVRHPARRGLLEWHWPVFSKTKLAQYYLNKSMELHGSEHEGMVFTKNVCRNIHTMLENNDDIREDLFKVVGSCVEEFAFQTISMNESNSKNSQVGWINICFAGADTSATVPTDPTMFIYKVRRV
jgi:hypothetical protein